MLFCITIVDHLVIGSGGISWAGIMAPAVVLAVVLAVVAAIVLIWRWRRRRNYSSDLLLDNLGEPGGAMDIHEISIVPLAGVRGADGHVAVPDGDGEPGGALDMHKISMVPLAGVRPPFNLKLTLRKKR